MFEILHPIYKSIYEGVEIPKPKEQKKKLFENPQIISENTLIPVDELDDRLTLEQKQRRSDKLLRDYLDSFKE
jgi:hypothetical protein